MRYVPAVVREHDHLYPSLLIEFHYAQVLECVEDLYGMGVRAIRFLRQDRGVNRLVLACFQPHENPCGLLPKKQVL